MKLLKSIVRKSLSVFNLEIKKLVPAREQKSPEREQTSFWDVPHPICIYDDKTGDESLMEEFQKVRELLRNDRKREYPDSNIEFGDFTYGNPKI
jgi:hypothetical protein